LADETFAFGPFRLIPAEQILLQDGTPLRIGSRALEILIVLVEHGGETVRKDELIARTWPDTVVEEGTLRVHIAALRRALGDGREGKRYITNIPGRGYSFVAPVTRETRQAVAAPPSWLAFASTLPAPLTRVIGRADIIAAVVARVAQRRFLTIVGAGGIGKTTVAIAAAEAMIPSYPDGVWFVNLASVQDSVLVPSAVNAALGSPASIDALAALGVWLRDRRMLIVLDSCEHVVGAAAATAEAILKDAPYVCILATSREPLRAEGEWLLRLPSLRVPPDDASLTASEALGFPAVELFNERATAANDSFVLVDADIPAVLEICRRLDGVPLALELAAAQVGVFGVKGLAARLDDRLAVLTQGRRTALPRQQTLRATIDWSFGLLAKGEQTILKRLSVFAGDFTKEGAAAVGADDRGEACDVFDGLANLAAKSLITTDISGDITYHRLLDTTRTYALEKLVEDGQLEAVRRRHAEYHCDLFRRANAEFPVRPAGEWLAEYGRRIGDLRAALSWCFSATGDGTLGIALTIGGVPLWFRLSLIEECRKQLEQSLEGLKRLERPDAYREMQIFAALGATLNYTSSVLYESDAVWRATLRTAEQLGDADYLLVALWGLWMFSIGGGEYRSSLALAERFYALAGTDRPEKFVGDRMVGVSLHYLGDELAARRRLERMLEHCAAPGAQFHNIWFQYDQRTIARSNLSWVIWLLGYPDQAVGLARANVEDAHRLGHALSLCHALEAECLVALVIGDLTMAEHSVATMIDHAERHSIRRWQAWCLCLRGAVAVKGGDTAAGMRLLREGLIELRKNRFALRFTCYLGELAEALGKSGEIAEALDAIDEALGQCEQSEELWCIPELLRIKGDILCRGDMPGAARDAETCFRDSLDRAHRQNALSFELRAATSLVRLWRQQNRVDQANDLLRSVYDRFAEGFDTGDLRAAKALLEQLA
jgi:predicted ATPase/DNA-binding winged helix-turn-helix (wHTH) protein